MLSFLAGLTVYGTTPAYLSAQTAFTDVEDSFAKDAILKLASQGILKGKTDTTFDPTGSIKREDFAIIMAKALNLDVSQPPSTPTFSDVSPMHYAYAYVEAAAQAGIFAGMGNGVFGQGSDMTRQDMAVIFVRALEKSGYKMPEAPTTPPFTDYATIAEYARDSVAVAYQLGLMSGNSDGSFAPTGLADRQQVALVADNFIVEKQTIENTQTTTPSTGTVPTTTDTVTPSTGTGSTTGTDSGSTGGSSDTGSTDSGSSDSGSSDSGGSGGTGGGSSDDNDPVTPAVNHAPVVAGALANLTLTVGDSAKSVSVSSLFTDEDNDALALQVSVSDPSKVSAGISGDTLSITPVAAGTATVTVTADDGKGGVVSTSFTVTVKAKANSLPVAVNPVPAQTLNLGTPVTIDITNTFSDNDGDPLTITVSSTDSTKVTATLLGKIITLTPRAIGTANVRMIVRDGKGSIVSTFAVTVVEVENHSPTVASSPSDQTLVVGTSGTAIDTSAVFADQDNDALTVTAASSNANVVSASMTGSLLQLTPVSAGSSAITLTATDGKGGTISVSFDVTVTQITVPVPVPVNHDPTVSVSIGSQSVTLGTTGPSIDLANRFADQDGDSLTYTAVSSDSAVASVTVNGSQLDITPVAVGTATVTVTANDGRGGDVSATFDVTVTQITIPVPVPENHDPTVTASIGSQSVTLGTTGPSIDLANRFADQDGDSLTYTAVSSDSAVASVTVNGSQLDITPVGVGTATVTVTANDGHGGSESVTFDVTVTQITIPVPVPENHDPTVTASIGSQSVTLGTTGPSIDLANRFADQDGDSLTYTAVSSDSAVASVTVNGSQLDITPVGVGTATVTVTANDGHGGSESVTFDVTVTQITIPVPVPVNHDPTVTASIGSQSVTLGATGPSIDLANRFADQDGDSLTYTAVSSDSAVASVTVNGSQLDITPVAVGTSTITVTVNDGRGGTATMTFDVTVTQVTVPTPVNHDPTVADVIGAQSWTLGTAGPTIDLTNRFADQDGDSLTYTAVSSDSAVAAVTVTGGELKLNALAVGTSTITVTADDGNGGSVFTTFNATVLQPNQQPVAANVIGAQSTTVGANDLTLDISNTFSDAEGDALTYSVVTADPSVATATITGNSLVIQPVAAGTTTVTLTADDGNNPPISMTFDLTVNNPIPPVVNHQPTVANPIGNKTSTTANLGMSVDISNTFADEDGDTLTYSATSSDTIVARASMSGTLILIDIFSVGTTTVTLTADDGNGGTASTTFDVTITSPAPVNHDPQVISGISGYTVTEGSGEFTIDISSTFSDQDGDILTYSAVADDGSVATAVLSGTTLSVNPLAAGTTNITVTADDGKGGSVSSTFAVQVNPLPVNHAPVMNSAFAAQTMNFGGADRLLNLTGRFTDEDQDTLTYTVSFSNPSVASAVVNGSNLVLTPGAAGTTTVTVTASDGKGGTASMTFTATVVVPPPAPLFSEYLVGSNGRIAVEIFYAGNGTGDSISGYTLEVHQYVEATQSVSIITQDLGVIYPNTPVVTIESTFYDYFDLASNAWYYNFELPLYVSGKRTVAYVIKKNGQVIDVLGDPTSTTELLSAGGTMVRKPEYKAGTTMYRTSQWTLYPKDSYQFIGIHSAN